jgi:hypothetical protein
MSKAESDLVQASEKKKHENVTDFVPGEFYFRACRVEKVYLCLREEVADKWHLVKFLHEGREVGMYLSDARNQLWKERT